MYKEKQETQPKKTEKPKENNNQLKAKVKTPPPAPSFSIEKEIIRLANEAVALSGEDDCDEELTNYINSLFAVNKGNVVENAMNKITDESVFDQLLSVVQCNTENAPYTLDGAEKKQSWLFVIPVALKGHDVKHNKLILSNKENKINFDAIFNGIKEAGLIRPEAEVVLSNYLYSFDEINCGSYQRIFNLPNNLKKELTMGVLPEKVLKTDLIPENESKNMVLRYLVGVVIDDESVGCYLSNFQDDPAFVSLSHQEQKEKKLMEIVRNSLNSALKFDGSSNYCKVFPLSSFYDGIASSLEDVYANKIKFDFNKLITQKNIAADAITAITSHHFSEESGGLVQISFQSNASGKVLERIILSFDDLAWLMGHSAADDTLSNIVRSLSVKLNILISGQYDIDLSKPITFPGDFNQKSINKELIKQKNINKASKEFAKSLEYGKNFH
jgi:hypothetical protein